MHYVTTKYDFTCRVFEGDLCYIKKIPQLSSLQEFIFESNEMIITILNYIDFLILRKLCIHVMNFTWYGYINSFYVLFLLIF